MPNQHGPELRKLTVGTVIARVELRGFEPLTL
jgi:hypothetical protein